MEIKRVLLAVAQSRSLHVVHEAYLCKSCFRNAIYQHFNFMTEKGKSQLGIGKEKLDIHYFHNHFGIDRVIGKGFNWKTKKTKKRRAF